MTGTGAPAHDGFSRAVDFPVHRLHQTRWSDNDVYGHVNNVVHYAIADTAVNAWLIEASGVDIRGLPALGVVAETGCRYLRELSFPDLVDVGIGLERLGRSSVVYRIGLFTADHERAPYALIRFVHVYVDRGSRRPVVVPSQIHRAVAMLAKPDPATQDTTPTEE